MLAVVDTNVWVPAHLSLQGAPARLLEQLAKGNLQPVFSTAILDEYRQVLFRPKFAIGHDVLEAFLTTVTEKGRRAEATAQASPTLPDPTDWPFIATALAAACPVVTGNLRHFPPECGVEVLTPGQCLARLTPPAPDR